MSIRDGRPDKNQETPLESHARYLADAIEEYLGAHVAGDNFVTVRARNKMRMELASYKNTKEKRF